MHTRKLALVPQPVAPPVAALDDSGDAPTLRVAIATQDGKTMNAHFGSARRFVVYEVGPARSRLVEAVVFDGVSDESGTHRGDDRIGAKIDALRGCQLLFVLAIGGPAAAKVVSARIHPIKLATPEPIDDVIAKVQALMTGTPPPWLRRVLVSAASQPRSHNFLEEDEP